jgi:hypothetical protein
MVFIESGYLRIFNIVNGKEITYWIGNTSKFITSVSSFIFRISKPFKIVDY